MGGGDGIVSDHSKVLHAKEKLLEEENGEREAIKEAELGIGVGEGSTGGDGVDVSFDNGER